MDEPIRLIPPAAKSYQPIACGLHSYFEIACMQQYPVCITRTNGDEISGKAITTQTQNQMEWLEIEGNGRIYWLRMDDIAKMQSLQDNPHFDCIHFQE